MHPSAATLQIRPEQPGDREAILDLYRREFDRLGSPSWSGREGVCCLVAVEGAKLLGFGLSEPVGSVFGGGLARLLDSGVKETQLTWRIPRDPPLEVCAEDTVFSALAVVAGRRRQGVGRALTRARVAEAGAGQVFVHCVEGTGSAELYASEGFLPILSVADYYRNGAAMILMASRDPRRAG